MKEKRPSAGSTAGQMLPVISDKSSHVTQVTQGSRQDQLGEQLDLSEVILPHCLIRNEKVKQTVPQYSIVQ